MQTLHVGIASNEDMKARTLAVARGEIVPGRDEPKIWFVSTESFVRIFSDRNCSLLGEIAQHPPATLTELAQRTGRQPSNLSRTLKTMARYGLVTLARGPRGSLLPRVPWRRIVLTVGLDAPSAQAAE
ncbi:MAG: MarR family transcriptional regulator [Alphaproteobacteria bacterium]|nr:MarR family transcriptional regulator [Alphaproteobacteria bacterium]